jgi:hypothetical protein
MLLSLRERRRDPEFGWNNRSLPAAAALDGLAKTREEILRTIERLENLPAVLQPWRKKT